MKHSAGWLLPPDSSNTQAVNRWPLGRIPFVFRNVKGSLPSTLHPRFMDFKGQKFLFCLHQFREVFKEEILPYPHPHLLRQGPQWQKGPCQAQAGMGRDGEGQRWLPGPDPPARHPPGRQRCSFQEKSPAPPNSPPEARASVWCSPPRAAFQGGIWFLMISPQQRQPCGLYLISPYESIP